MTFESPPPGPDAGSFERSAPPTAADAPDVADPSAPPVDPSAPAPPATATATAASSGMRAIREIVETLLLAVVIFVAVRMVVLNFRVDGMSMVPNLHDQEMLLVNRNVYFHFDLNRVLNLLPGEDRNGQDIVYPFHPPERGDIIVFNPPVNPPSSKPYIKRVIAVAGETVTFENGSVYIDGQKLDEPYINSGITDCDGRYEYCDVTVPQGKIFVLGDNRQNSSDSRVFGPVSINSIIGKAWVTYWPFDDIGLVPHYDYPDISD
ncbi:MAG TPA: signal peptidase I [Thermomicrobiales bacterium]|nr:signal peptidase I [Thermomicrobiales bacterium]